MAVLTCGEGGSTGAEIVTQINANTDAIAAMGGFHYTSTVDNLDLPETYTEVAALAITSLRAGVYMLGISSTFHLDLVNKSVFSQFALNGAAPEEFRKEPKDNTDREAFSYSFPYIHNGNTDFHLSLAFRKEDANGTLDVLFANLTLDRKTDLP